MVAGVAMLAVGLGLLLYPAITAAIAQHDVDEALAAWRSGAVDGGDAGTVGETGAGSGSNAAGSGSADGAVASEDTAANVSADASAFRSKEGDATYQQLVDYNARVLAGEGGQINDPFAFSGSDLAELGLPDGIIGSISIPAMSVEIPLYLGATAANMEYGAGVVAGTSIPLGESTSNTVIAAHRGGWHGLPMFRDIEDLQVGDTVTVTTPWDKLTYRVSAFKVVSPDDTVAVGIQPGRDLITLLTCHPYGEHPSHHRILVFCERVPNDEAEQAPGPLAAAISQIVPGNAGDSPLLALEDALRVAGLDILLGTGMFLVMDSARRRRRTREQQRQKQRQRCQQQGPGLHRAEMRGQGSVPADADGADDPPSTGLHFK